MRWTRLHTPLLASLALLALPSLAAAQDADGDTFEPADGDCDDSDPGAFPGSAESCDGVDNDCDGVADEPGATPWNCNTTPVLEAPFSNGPDGHLIVHVEKWVDAVDFTGIPLWTSVQAGQNNPGGPETNVQQVDLLAQRQLRHFAGVGHPLFTSQLGGEW